MESLATILQRIAAQSSGKATANSTVGEPTPINCWVCFDRGFYTRSGELVQCACKKSAYEQHLRTKIADLPSELAASSIANFDQSRSVQGLHDAYEAGLALLDGRLIGLLLEGDAGLGKTHLAAALVKAFREQDMLARFVFVPDLIAELRMAIQADQSFDAIIESYAKHGFLVLDDLGRGRETPTPFEADALTRIIQARYAGNQPFVITTNRSFDDVAYNFGHGMADRMWNVSVPDRFCHVQLFGASARTNINYEEMEDQS
jgi:DNA replication protein DnaC